MFSWLSWFFDDLFYYIAIIALIGGVIAYTLSYLVGFLPMLKAHALILKVLGIFLVITGGYYVSDHHGYQRRMAEDQVEIDRLNQEARAKESELSKKLAQTGAALRKSKDENKSKQSSIDADIDAGRLQLPTSCALQANSDATTASGNTTNGAESTRQALKDIVQIAADGDNAIIQLNSCIATYNQVMQTVNGGVK